MNFLIDSEYQIHFKGHMFFGEYIISDSLGLFQLFRALSLSHISQLVALLPNFSGSWAFFLQLHSAASFAAVDRHRSIPIFYSSSIISFNLSDFTSHQLHPYSSIYAKHYRHHKISPPSYTLLDGVNSILPSHYYSSVSSTQLSYFNWDSIEPIEGDHTSGLNTIVSSLKQLVSILPKYAGQKVYVPLSGGMDSRLIATFLSHYKESFDIVCYTYGKSHSLDSHLSSQVASSLGLKWIFIDYTPLRFKNVIKNSFNSSFKHYPVKFVAPNFQETIAVDYLSEHFGPGLFCPGYCLDVPAGNFINPSEYSRLFLFYMTLVEFFINSPNNNWYYNLIEQRLSFTFGSLNWFEMSNCTHYSPFLSNQIFDFWFSLSHRQRRDRMLFKDVSKQFYQIYHPDLLSIPFTDSVTPYSRKYPDFSAFRTALKSNYFIDTIRSYIHPWHSIVDPDYLGMYDLVGDYARRGRSNHYHNLVTILAIDYIYNSAVDE